jgi:signal transduction histidine kinase
MELGRIERAAGAGSPLATTAIGCKHLVDELFSTVRNLALGLRPSMLDDFGLQAAIEWHARDFMRRYAIDVELAVEGDVDALPEKHRVCVYRVIQEAMTNCARHASASFIRVAMQTQAGYLHVRVSDNGVGVDPSTRKSGFGLRGIEERVKELGGSVTLGRQTAKGGTLLAVHLPVPAALQEEKPLARLAG